MSNSLGVRKMPFCISFSLLYKRSLRTRNWIQLLRFASTIGAGKFLAVSSSINVTSRKDLMKYFLPSFEQLKADFAKRHRFVSGLCASVEEDMSDEVIDSAWEQFKAGYYWQGA